MLSKRPKPPEVGHRCQIMVRMLAYPVSRPRQNGELAERASRVGRTSPIPTGQAYCQVGVGHPDVDLIAADQLLVDEEAVLLVHAAETALHGELEVLIGGLRDHAHGGHDEPEFAGHGP